MTRLRILRHGSCCRLAPMSLTASWQKQEEGDCKPELIFSLMRPAKIRSRTYLELCPRHGPRSIQRELQRERV